MSFILQMILQINNKKLSCCRDSSRYDKSVIDSVRRSANRKRNIEYDSCKFYFTDRVVNTWKSVPGYIVSANTLCVRYTNTDVTDNRQTSIPFWQPAYRLHLMCTCVFFTWQINSAAAATTTYVVTFAQCQCQLVISLFMDARSA